MIAEIPFRGWVLLTLIAVLLLGVLLMALHARPRRNTKTPALIRKLDAHDRTQLKDAANYHDRYADDLERPLQEGQLITRDSAARSAQHRLWASTLRRIAARE